MIWWNVILKNIERIQLSETGWERLVTKFPPSLRRYARWRQPNTLRRSPDTTAIRNTSLSAYALRTLHLTDIICRAFAVPGPQSSPDHIHFLIRQSLPRYAQLVTRTYRNVSYRIVNEMHTSPRTPPQASFLNQTYAIFFQIERKEKFTRAVSSLYACALNMAVITQNVCCKMKAISQRKFILSQILSISIYQWLQNTH